MHSDGSRHAHLGLAFIGQHDEDVHHEKDASKDDEGAEDEEEHREYLPCISGCFDHELLDGKEIQIRRIEIRLFIGPRFDGSEDSVVNGGICHTGSDDDDHAAAT